jgi:hypothetical protein
MLAFTDSQLRAVRTAAERVPVEKRGIFVERVVARLQLQRGFTNADLDEALRAALKGLIHRRLDPAAASRRDKAPMYCDNLPREIRSRSLRDGCD